MLVFTSFYASSMSAKFVTDAIKAEIQNTTQDQDIDSLIGDGYISIALLYAVFAFANFFAPAIVEAFGHKMALFVSSLTYLVYVVMYLYPYPAFMYVASVLIGIGAAVLWAAQSEFLHLQSPTDQLMMRNTGIFWCLFQISLTIGNLYIYLEWSGKNDVSRAEINRLFTGLSILCAVGGVLFLFLKAPFCQYEAPKHQSKEPEQNESDVAKPSKMAAIGISIKNTFSLLITPDALLSTPLFLYAGFSMSFYSGIFPTSIGNTKLFNDAASFLGLIGMLIGAGHVVAGSVFVFGATWINKLNRIVLLSICLLVQLGAFIMVFVNIPNSANQGETYDKPKYMDEPNKAMALVSAFLMAMGDAGVNNVIYTSVPIVWGDKSLPAYGLFKVFQTTAGAISFGIAADITLWTYLGIMIGSGACAFIGYIFLRRRDSLRENSN